MNKNLKNIPIHFVLILASILSLFPFLWLLSTALKGGGENIFAYPPQLVPDSPTFENFIGVWNKIHFIKYFLNSFIVAGVTVVLNLLLSSLAAYPLARMDFRGRHFVFFAVLSTIMVPFQAIMLPVYLITLKLNLVDSAGIINGYLGLILPFAVSAFGIFLMRQAFLQIPKELEEAAIIDGCNAWQVWWKVVMPLVKPNLAVLAIFVFIGAWGEFLWPSIVLSNKSLYTLPVGVNDLQGMFSANWRYIAAGALISIVPIIIFFVLMQKFFVSGSTEGAVKG